MNLFINITASVNNGFPQKPVEALLAKINTISSRNGSIKAIASTVAIDKKEHTVVELTGLTESQHESWVGVCRDAKMAFKLKESDPWTWVVKAETPEQKKAREDAAVEAARKKREEKEERRRLAAKAQKEAATLEASKKNKGDKAKGDKKNKK